MGETTATGRDVPVRGCEATQGSDDWLKSRLGWVTCSRFCDVMTNARSKSGLSQTAERYMLDLIGEHLTGKPASTVKVPAMEWGNTYEPLARQEYEERTERTVALRGFVPHGNEPFVGGSPDGAILGDFLDTGIIEIKCPMTQANHARVIMSGQMPDDHVDQVQGYMWLTAAHWCDFISFHPDFPDKWRLLVIRVPRDDDYIEQLRFKVLAFRDEMLRRLNLIVERWE